MYKSCVSTINTGFNDTKKAKNHVKKKTKKKASEQNKGGSLRTEKTTQSCKFSVSFTDSFSEKREY